MRGHSRMFATFAYNHAQTHPIMVRNVCLPQYVDCRWRTVRSRILLPLPCQTLEMTVGKHQQPVPHVSDVSSGHHW